MIYTCDPEGLVVEFMFRVEGYLRNILIILPVLVLCGISPSVLGQQSSALAPWVGTSLNGKTCFGRSIYSPIYDYLQRDIFPQDLAIVEQYHFSEGVESLQEGLSSTPIGDIHYVLMQWPNHHRALYSALQYRLQHLVGDWPEPVHPPAECYLQRAIKFSPNDPVPHMLYGMLMDRVKQYDKALTSYRAANRLLPDDVITQYNIGLMLVELKRFNEAVQVAKKVYSTGFPLPGLKKKLIAAGHWKAEAGETASNPAKQELTPAQIDAIKKAMLDEAARKKAAAAAAP